MLDALFGRLFGLRAFSMRIDSRLLAAAFAVSVVSTFAGSSSPASAREVVAFNRGTPGTIVVRTNERRLYLVLGEGRAIRYKVGVGRAGKQWTGASIIDGKHRRPAWSPPADVRRDQPSLPDVIQGGSPHNPMGVAALTLAGGEYAIHGTNAPSSIGGFVSYGCIRMYNEDIADLYDRVDVGTQVVVTR
jgi:lipoprotein-anchoring transpeptidase ErfK/SrfK